MFRLPEYLYQPDGGADNENSKGNVYHRNQDKID
jgi:hypothetical protein